MRGIKGVKRGMRGDTRGDFSAFFRVFITFRDSLWELTLKKLEKNCTLRCFNLSFLHYFGTNPQRYVEVFRSTKGEMMAAVRRKLYLMYHAGTHKHTAKVLVFPLLNPFLAFFNLF